MERGTKEFYEVQAAFEKGLKYFPVYIPCDFTKDTFTATTYYANGEVNKAFLIFMAGYSLAKCEYQQADSGACPV